MREHVVAELVERDDGVDRGAVVEDVEVGVREVDHTRSRPARRSTPRGCSTRWGRSSRARCVPVGVSTISSGTSRPTSRSVSRRPSPVMLRQIGNISAIRRWMALPPSRDPRTIVRSSAIARIVRGRSAGDAARHARSDHRGVARWVGVGKKRERTGAIRSRRGWEAARSESAGRATFGAAHSLRRSCYHHGKRVAGGSGHAGVRPGARQRGDLRNRRTASRSTNPTTAGQPHRRLRPVEQRWGGDGLGQSWRHVRERGSSDDLGELLERAGLLREEHRGRSDDRHGLVRDARSAASASSTSTSTRVSTRSLRSTPRGRRSAPPVP